MSQETLPEVPDNNSEPRFDLHRDLGRKGIFAAGFSGFCATYLPSDVADVMQNHHNSQSVAWLLIDTAIVIGGASYAIKCYRESKQNQPE